MPTRRVGRQFSVLDGYAALLERDRREEVPADDLLAEEREMASRSRWWRPWWLRAGFSGDVFHGQKGTLAAIGVLAAVGGWLVWMMATGGGGTGLGGELGGWDVDGDYEISAEAGRGLRVSEVELGLAFGEPVELGPGGLPVVVHGSTGVERELTVMEEEFYEEYGPSGLSGVEMGVNQVVWNPGPQGWGMWWKESGFDRVSKAELAFTREGWREKQEDELQWVVGHVEEAFVVLDQLEDPLVRERGLGAQLGFVLDRVVDRYPDVRERRGVSTWSAIPMGWVCSEELEFGATGGISQGCPSVAYRGAVSEVWGSVGALFGELSEFARLMNYMDGLSTRQYFASGTVPELYLGLIDAIEVEMANLGRAIWEMRSVSAYDGFYFNVDVFGDGGG